MLAARVSISRSLLSHTLARRLRTGVRCLSTFEKHKDIFSQFGIQKTGNQGVFDGTWKGSGPTMASMNPVNNEVIAEVVSVCLAFRS